MKAPIPSITLPPIQWHHHSVHSRAQNRSHANQQLRAGSRGSVQALQELNSVSGVSVRSHNMPAACHSRLVLWLAAAAAVAVAVLPLGAHGLAPGKHLPRPEDVPYIKCQVDTAFGPSELDTYCCANAIGVCHIMRGRLRQRQGQPPTSSPAWQQVAACCPPTPSEPILCACAMAASAAGDLGCHLWCSPRACFFLAATLCRCANCWQRMPGRRWRRSARQPRPPTRQAISGGDAWGGVQRLTPAGSTPGGWRADQFPSCCSCFGCPPAPA